MASNILSRLLPPGSPSVYETLRNDAASDTSDVEERAGMSIDEENLGHENFDLRPSLVEGMEHPQASPSDSLLLQESQRPPRRTTLQRETSGATDEADDDVPLSLLVEANQDISQEPLLQQSPDLIPVVGQASSAVRAKWNAARAQQGPDEVTGSPSTRRNRKPRPQQLLGDPKEKASWRWTNVQNLDNFLTDVYQYFLGKGIWSILLHRVINLLTTAFVVGFSVFLGACIDYNKLPHKNKLGDILVPQCTKSLSGFWSFLLWLCAFSWIAKFAQYLLDIRRLKHMHDFYYHLLEISDTDIQTISWQDVVKKLMALRDLNPTTAAKVSDRHKRFLGTQSKQRMDAHDIANRLMRRDNYLIALINKDILDTTLPFPFLGTRSLFSKSLEWNLSFCILDFVFDEKGQVRPLFLKDSHRRALSDGLKRRFLVAGLISIVCAPFIIVYLVVFYFFRYFNQYQKDPSSISLRQYTPYAEWKFREFNELWHLFERRMKMSYPFANRYINQFPKDKTVQLFRFAAFISGALAAVLGIMTLVDHELFLGFEITPERNVLFYLSVFTAIWAFTSGSVPEENLVFDPEFALTAVVNYTHYLPSHWRSKLHGDEVRKEFVELYQLRFMIFLEELLSIITTPYILCFSLPKCSDRIVDFFREFTVHLDGLGYVCSFAVFDFERGGANIHRPGGGHRPDELNLRDDYYSAKDGKMLASYYNFVDNYVTNPKQGMTPYPQTPDRRHQAYRSIAGLGSTNLQPDAARGDPQERQHKISARQVGASQAPSSQRVPRFAGASSATAPPPASPMMSILLDPQHQPLQSGIKNSQKIGTQSRLRASRKLPVKDVMEDNEDEQEQQQQQQQQQPQQQQLSQDNPPSAVVGSASDEVDQHLGGSWKTAKAGTIDEDEEQDGAGRTSGGLNGPGVLGLVYQFSKAQTDNRGVRI